MSAQGWRRTALLLLAVVVFLAWRDCNRSRALSRLAAEQRNDPSLAPATPPPAPTPTLDPRGDARAPRPPAHGDEQHSSPPGGDWREQLAAEIAGHWVVQFLTPRPGETLLDYRDRVIPAAQLAIAPQRSRVATARDQFFERAQLDEDHARILTDVVDRAGDDIQNRIMQGVLSGEILPPQVKPTTAVTFVHDVLERVVRADRQFRDALDERQRAILDQGRFDLADYLLFNTRWEDALGYTGDSP